MRSVIFAALTFFIMTFAATTGADAMSDGDTKKMLTKLVHSYYKSDSDTFWKIVSRFENPQFKNREDVHSWMEERLALQMTYLKVDGLIVSGMSIITSEKLGDIKFRFDGSENSKSRVIVVTAWVSRVIQFDDTVPLHHRTVDQDAILKIYVTLLNERLKSYYSNELNFGYSFASQK